MKTTLLFLSVFALIALLQSCGDASDESLSENRKQKTAKKGNLKIRSSDSTLVDAGHIDLIFRGNSEVFINGNGQYQKRAFDEKSFTITKLKKGHKYSLCVSGRIGWSDNIKHADAVYDYHWDTLINKKIPCGVETPIKSIFWNYDNRKLNRPINDKPNLRFCDSGSDDDKTYIWNLEGDDLTHSISITDNFAVDNSGELFFRIYEYSGDNYFNSINNQYEIPKSFEELIEIKKSLMFHAFGKFESQNEAELISNKEFKDIVFKMIFYCIGLPQSTSFSNITDFPVNNEYYTNIKYQKIRYLEYLFFEKFYRSIEYFREECQQFVEKKLIMNPRRTSPPPQPEIRF